jgi:hypothetical protein
VLSIKEACVRESKALDQLQDGRNRGNIAYQQRKYAEAVAAYTQVHEALSY